MNTNKYGAFSSSIDPQQLSTTALAVAKTVAGLLVFAGFFTVADSTTFFSHVSAIITDITVVAPLAYAMWHSSEIVFGLLQKALVKATQKTSVTSAPMAMIDTSSEEAG